MKRISFVILVLTIALPLAAQEEGDTLQEVTIEASRTVEKNGELWLYPSQAQLQHATNSYDLLRRLPLTGIRVDPIAHSLSAIDNRGGISVRINDVPATKADLLALDPKTIRRVEFSDHPTLRYDNDIAYTLNIVTRRTDSGYSYGGDLTHSLTCRGLSDNLFGQVNTGKSEWKLSFGINGADDRRSDISQTADYELNDGTQKTIIRITNGRRSRSLSQTSQLQYSLADSTYLLQARITFGADLRPSFYHAATDIIGGSVPRSEQRDHSQQRTPAFDLYYNKVFPHHQKITASAVVTHIHTKSDNSYEEQTPYLYHVHGRAWSLKSEALYENQLKPFTLTIGMNYDQKYTANTYTGDATAEATFRSSTQRAYAQISGTLAKLQYTLALGGTHRYYRQASYSDHFSTFTPQLSLRYPLAKPLALSYQFNRYQRVSQIAVVNDVVLRVNDMEATAGSPDLKPTRVTEHTLTLSYTKPRLRTSMQTFVRLNNHPNMESFLRTDDNTFVRKQFNQPHCNMLQQQLSATWTIIPEKLDATMQGIYGFFDNRGDDYHHCYNSFMGVGWVSAYLGHWSLMAYGDTGWRFMEGETIGRNGATVQLSASYQMGNASLSLFCTNPFRAHPLSNRSGVMSRYLHKVVTLRDGDNGNYFGVSLTWRISHGKGLRKAERTIDLKDTDAGILSR